MKRIQLTEEDVQEMISKFTNDLKGMRTRTDKINYTLTPKKPEAEPTKVIFLPEAWCKMKALIEECSKEIAWHGIVTKTENEYIIEDIMMYPQEITGATVTSNDEKYPIWLSQLPDETFNKLKFQGHSHVNFTATPSGTDIALYEKFLKDLDSDSFYIFLIMNKSGDFWIEVYDLAKNLIYEKNDIELAVRFSDGSTDTTWYLESTKNNIIEKQTNYSYNNYHNLTNITPKQVSTPLTKYGDPSWVWDTELDIFYPSKASKTEIEQCIKKAKLKAKSKVSYYKELKKEFEKLHDILEEEEKDENNFMNYLKRNNMLGDDY